MKEEKGNENHALLRTERKTAERKSQQWQGGTRGIEETNGSGFGLDT